jgi:hypothetical protein
VRMCMRLRVAALGLTDDRRTGAAAGADHDSWSDG